MFLDIQCDGIMPLAVIGQADLHKLVAIHVHHAGSGKGSHEVLRQKLRRKTKGSGAGKETVEEGTQTFHIQSSSGYNAQLSKNMARTE